METTCFLGVYRDNGQENGNHYRAEVGLIIKRAGNCACLSIETKAEQHFSTQFSASAKTEICISVVCRGHAKVAAVRKNGYNAELKEILEGGVTPKHME